MNDPTPLILPFDPSTRREADFMPKRPLMEIARTVFAPRMVLLTPYVYLIDCSKWQKVIDWAQYAAAGYKIAILKASEGKTIIDGYFEANWRGCLANNILPLPYHFFRSNIDGLEQANWHKEVIRFLVEATGGKLLPSAVDVETADSTSVTTRRARLYAMLTELKKDRKPVIYTSKSLWGSLIGDVPWCTEFWGWVAHWTSAAEPLLPLRWTREMTRLWQKGISGQHSWIPAPIPGVTTTVDYNLFYGTVEDAYAWAGYPVLSLEQRVARIEAEARNHGWPI